MVRRTVCPASNGVSSVANSIQFIFIRKIQFVSMYDKSIKSTCILRDPSKALLISLGPLGSRDGDHMANEGRGRTIFVDVSLPSQHYSYGLPLYAR